MFALSVCPEWRVFIGEQNVTSDTKKEWWFIAFLTLGFAWLMHGPRVLRQECIVKACCMVEVRRGNRESTSNAFIWGLALLQPPGGGGGQMRQRAWHWSKKTRLTNFHMMVNLQQCTHGLWGMSWACSWFEPETSSLLVFKSSVERRQRTCSRQQTPSALTASFWHKCGSCWC